MVIDSGTELDRKGCWNLTTDMVIAFFFKNWGRGNDGSETFSNRLVQSLLGIPTAAFWATLKAPLRPFLAYPVEGTCSSQEPDSLCKTIQRFEQEYQDALFVKRGESLDVPDRCSDESDPAEDASSP